MQAKYLREGLEVYPRSLAQVQAQGALMDGAALAEERWGSVTCQDNHGTR